ncbi:MAG TPA: hypothetical protein VJ722_03125 [Rhodanobacteraceae bacterium]|nr:hypothetical protein [Rhodanobacteraceae bacterium]
MADKKVQGEGDYESARHYRKATERSAKEQTKGGKPIQGDASKATDKLSQEEREGRSHAKELRQDKRDAKYMDELEKKKKG